jgi:spermidine synthase
LCRDPSFNTNNRDTKVPPTLRRLQRWLFFPVYDPPTMSRDFEELDYQKTPLGELILRRRRMLSLGGTEIYEVKLGEAFLMSSLFHEVEEALAHLGLAELKGENWDVVVGGLGLGYTAVAALEHRNVASLLVVDALQPVIEWHRRGLVPLGKKLTGDGRTRLVHADFFVRALSADGFDSGQPGRKFHAVLLDIDHSPRNLLHPRNAAFYELEGLRALAAHLHPGGVFALWSDDAPEEEFLGMLSGAFANARAHVVTFPNPLTEAESASTVYVALTGGATAVSSQK